MLFQHLVRRYQRPARPSCDEESNGQLERPAAAYRHTEASCQPATEPRPVSAPPAANVPLPPYPQRRPSDKGSKKQVQAENANALHKSSDSETDRLQDIQEEPHRCIGSSRVKELAKFFTPTSDEEEHSRVNSRTRRKKLFEPKKEEGSKK